MNGYFLSGIIIQIIGWSLLAENFTGDINIGLMPIPFFIGSIVLFCLSAKYGGNDQV